MYGAHVCHIWLGAHTWHIHISYMSHINDMCLAQVVLYICHKSIGTHTYVWRYTYVIYIFIHEAINWHISLSNIYGIAYSWLAYLRYLNIEFFLTVIRCLIPILCAAYEWQTHTYTYMYMAWDIYVWQLFTYVRHWIFVKSDVIIICPIWHSTHMTSLKCRTIMPYQYVHLYACMCVCLTRVISSQATATRTKNKVGKAQRKVTSAKRDNSIEAKRLHSILGTKRPRRMPPTRRRRQLRLRQRRRRRRRRAQREGPR